MDATTKHKFYTPCFYYQKAALAVEDPIGKLYPVSPEEISEIEMLNKIYEFVWKKIKISSTLREIIGTSKLLGTGILHMFWNESGVHGGKGTLYKGEIEVCQVEPSCFILIQTLLR